MLLVRIIIAFVLLPFSLHAQTIDGKVISVTDGDTIKILTPVNKQIKIRLAAIDAPEKRQPYGKKSKQILSDKIFGKVVSVVKVTTDRYRRLVGKIYLGGRYINAEMVDDGAVWVYRKYIKDPGMLAIERNARDNRKGLWAL